MSRWPKKSGAEIVLFLFARKFRSLSEENIAQLLHDKDSENTKKSTKHILNE